MIKPLTMQTLNLDYEHPKIPAMEWLPVHAGSISDLISESTHNLNNLMPFADDIDEIDGMPTVTDFIFFIDMCNELLVVLRTDARNTVITAAQWNAVCRTFVRALKMKHHDRTKEIVGIATYLNSLVGQPEPSPEQLRHITGEVRENLGEIIS